MTWASQRSRNRTGSGSSVFVPRSESFSQVAEYQIGQFSPKLRVLMVELKDFYKKNLICNYIFYIKITEEANTVLP